MGAMRRWGQGPYMVAVLHGGPGAPGEVAPLARELSSACGVLEPFQAATTLDGQVQELHDTLVQEDAVPCTLIGFSYGAVLAYLYTARHPDHIKKLVLIGCPPFEEHYAARITATRLERLNAEQRGKAQELEHLLADPSRADKHEIFYQMGKLMAAADSLNPVQAPDEVIRCQYDVYQPVWEEVRALRQSGTLLAMGTAIECPVVAIHGDYDPHPVDGVREPLSRVLRTFRCITLKNCGHRPWIEQDAIDQFYSALMREI